MSDINVRNLKKFRGGIRLDTSRDETELLGTDAEAEGTLIYDKNTKGLKIRNDGGFTAVGGGSGGGLDTFYTEDFTTQALADGNTGTDKFVKNTGGTISFTSDADEISERSLKITLGTDPDDSLTSPAIVLKKRQQGQTCSISFYYKTDTFVDDDMKLEVLSGTSIGAISTPLVSDNIKASTTIKKFVTTFTIPSDATHLQYKFINKSTSGTKLIYVDDVEMSQDPFVQADLGTITEWTVLTGQQSLWSHSTNMNVAEVSYRRVGSNVEVQFLSTWNGAAGGDNATHLKLSLPAGLTINTSALPELEGKAVLGSMQMYETSSPYQHPGIVTYKTNTQIMFVDAEGNDYAEDFGASGTSMSGSFSVPVQGWGSTNSHIITPAKSNLTDWVSYTPTTPGIVENGVTFEREGKWRRVGDSMEIQAKLRRASGSGSPTGHVSFSLPSGYTMDRSKILDELNEIGDPAYNIYMSPVGTGVIGNDQGSAQDEPYPVMCYASGESLGNYTNTIQVMPLRSDAARDFAHHASGATRYLATVNGNPFAWQDAGDYCIVKVSVPITGWGAQDSNFLAALPMTKYQKKQLSSDWGSTNGLTALDNALGFSNLTAGKIYKLTLHINYDGSPTGTGDFYVTAINGDASTAEIAANTIGIVGTDEIGDPYIVRQNASFIFKAINSVITYRTGDMQSGDVLRSADPALGFFGTSVMLEELPMHEEVETW